jgi:hypothetical protein
MNGELHTPHPPPGSSPGADHKRNHGGVKDWSRPSRAEAPALTNTRPAATSDKPPPKAFVQSLNQFLGDEMRPVRVDRLHDPRWALHLGAGVLRLPWPRRWAFKRKGAHDAADLPSFKDHVIVGSWRIPSEPLDQWIAAAEATASTGLERERALCRLHGDDPSPVTRGFKIGLLPPQWNWMEPIGPDVESP